MSNVSPTVLSRIGRHLHRLPGHPLAITKRLIESYFGDPRTFPPCEERGCRPHHVQALDDLPPVVTPQANFDALCFPPDHPGRARSDTYYVNAEHLLRTHTSAHQHDALRSHQAAGYLISADVYRRDEIDASHYPVFHQTEGIYTMGPAWQQAVIAAAPGPVDLQPLAGRPTWIHAGNPIQGVHDPRVSLAVGQHLRDALEGLVRHVFGAAAEAKRDASPAPAAAPGVPIQPASAMPATDLPMRWIEGSFPFTSPSWELEVFWEGQWLELLGCGVVQQSIMDRAGLSDHVGWAFGIGLERLAMVMFGIPDIRYFWSEDERFLSQFADGRVRRFVPYSRYPVCYKDVSFWRPAAGFEENALAEITREVAGDSVERLECIDTFTHPKTGRTSMCYRVHYRHMDRTLTNAEVDAWQAQIAARMAQELGVEIRG
ncbi:hypothetical protein CXG81DRAFT_16856 [Caulochytrium protostelioides]|nr:hypothetical protein CXG81DRAFT_16856 [Caulochytrium protostelioides]|eukprot:RKP03624.1 hypothetical protein CXG81DRAFT_16856 [Caulochytrium protostelioides]